MDTVFPTTLLSTTVSPEVTPFLVTSSPPDPAILRSINRAFIIKISAIEVATPVKNHM